jgi:hypothetical protein
VPEAEAFPDHYKFVSSVPLLRVDSAAPVSSQTERFSFTTYNTRILSLLPLGAATLSSWNPGLDRAKVLYLFGPGGGVLPRAIVAAAPIRQLYPQYPWTFFTGGGVSALFFEQNNGLTVRNISICDFPGTGIHAEGNRGTLTFDHINILATSPSLRGAASAGMQLYGNQYGPTVTNSVIQNTTDNGLELLIPVPFRSIGGLSGASVQLSYPFYALGAQTVLPGDRFWVLNSNTGNSLGDFTVASVAPLVVARSQANALSVTFNQALPAAAGDPSTVFVDLDQIGSGADIEDNLFINGARQGITVNSSATIRNNLSVGLGLHAVIYTPFAPPILPSDPGGVWGDFGPVDVAGNTAIADWQFLEIVNLSTASNYKVPTASITITGNAIYRPYSDTFVFTNKFPLNIAVPDARIFTSTSDPRRTIADFVSITGKAAPKPFSVSLERLAPNKLWDYECNAAKAWFNCSTGGAVREWAKSPRP